MNKRNNWEQVLGYANEDLKSKGFSIKIKKQSDGYYSCEIRKGRKLYQVYAENYFEEELADLLNEAWVHANNVALKEAAMKAAKKAAGKQKIYSKKVKQMVAGQIVTMLVNNVLNGNGTEKFMNWIEDGDAFSNAEVYTDKEVADATALCKEIAKSVDTISEKLKVKAGQ